jgi:putative transposase
VRRAQGPARGDRNRLAASDHPDLHRAHTQNSFRYASNKHWPAIGQDLKPIYTAPSESAALDAFTEAWGNRYPAIIKLWESAWAEFVLFRQFDNSIRTVVCTPNAIESINARSGAVNARGHFRPSRLP